MQHDDMHKVQPPGETDPGTAGEDPVPAPAADQTPPDPASPPAAGRSPRRTKLSAILSEIAADATRERVSVGDLLRTMHGRAIAALMLIFAFPNVLPSPPGTSGILGLPLVYLASQMMLGRLPWLPGFIANRSVARADFGAMVSRVGPVLAWAERLLKPRLPFLVNSGTERIIGAVCLVLAVILLLPIPFGNMLPALAICIFALALLERDGAWVLAGLLMAGLAAMVAAGVVYALIKAALFVVMNAFA
jgi:hypothetical protein